MGGRQGGTGRAGGGRGGRMKSTDWVFFFFFLHKDVIRLALFCERRKGRRIELRDIRKQSVPSTNSTVAAATKNGPAAPVIQSPQRSMRLKHAKTKWGRGQGMTRNWA